MKLTYPLKPKGESKSQTIIAKVGVVGTSFIDSGENQTSKDKPRRFAQLETGNENVSLTCYGEQTNLMKRGDIIKTKIVNLEKRMKGYWRADFSGDPDIL